MLVKLGPLPLEERATIKPGWDAKEVAFSWRVLFKLRTSYYILLHTKFIIVQLMVMVMVNYHAHFEIVGIFRVRVRVRVRDRVRDRLIRS
jgi:hypothetical protein